MQGHPPCIQMYRVGCRAWVDSNHVTLSVWREEENIEGGGFCVRPAVAW